MWESSGSRRGIWKDVVVVGGGCRKKEEIGERCAKEVGGGRGKEAERGGR